MPSFKPMIVLFLGTLSVQAIWSTDISKVIAEIGYRDWSVSIRKDHREHGNRSSIRELTLYQKTVGEIKIYMQVPSDIKQGEKLPVIFLMAGFDTAKETIKLADLFGRNIVITYDYPIPVSLDIEKIHEWLKWGILESIEKIPGQITSITKWLYAQDFVDTSRLNLVSVSLGTLFSPLGQRLSSYFDRPFVTMTLGYGGVEIGELAYKYFKEKGRKEFPFLGAKELHILAKIAANEVSQAFSSLEPGLHLPQLKGDFLLIYGREEELFPKISMERQQELTPEPKETVWLEGRHVKLKRRGLTLKLLQTVHQWLLKKEMVN